MLKDSDHDGTFDQSVVYASDLPWPTAVMCYDGGIFVGATPDIFISKIPMATVQRIFGSWFLPGLLQRAHLIESIS
jgi:hypothetical protein